MMYEIVTRFAVIGATVILLVAVECCTAVAGRHSGTEGIPVRVAGSPVDVVAVTSDWESNQMFFDGRIQPGPIYFNDCVSFVNRAEISLTRVQVIFAMVNASGEIKRKPLPLDIRNRAEPNATQNPAGSCRAYAYANRDRGLWLVAWVNVVDFVDGTSWHAPPVDMLQDTIEEALPRDP